MRSLYARRAMRPAGAPSVTRLTLDRFQLLPASKSHGLNILPINPWGSIFCREFLAKLLIPGNTLRGRSYQLDNRSLRNRTSGRGRPISRCAGLLQTQRRAKID